MLAFQVLMPQVFRRTTPMMAILTVELYGKVYCWTKRKILASSFIELLVYPNQRTLGLLNILTTRSYTFIQQDSLTTKLAFINVVQQLIIGGFSASLLDVKHLFNKILLFINGPRSRKNQHDKNSQSKVSFLFGFSHNLILLNNNFLNHMCALLEQLLFSCTDERSIGTLAS